MTSNYHQDDRVSARFDSELSADEQSALGDCDELTSELESFQRLSGLIQNAEVGSAPASLAQGVMSGIAKAPVPEKVTKPPVPPTRGMGRWVGVAGIVTAAAIMLLMVKLTSSDTKPESVARTAQRDMAADSMAVSESPTLESLADEAKSFPGPPKKSVTADGDGEPMAVAQDLVSAIARSSQSRPAEVAIVEVTAGEANEVLTQLTGAFSAEQVMSSQTPQEKEAPPFDRKDENVTAVYVSTSPDQLRSALRRLDMHIEPGQMALVGNPTESQQEMRERLLRILKVSPFSNQTIAKTESVERAGGGMGAKDQPSKEGGDRKVASAQSVSPARSRQGMHPLAPRGGSRGTSKKVPSAPSFMPGTGKSPKSLQTPLRVLFVVKVPGDKCVDDSAANSPETAPALSITT